MGTTQTVISERDYFRSILYNDFIKPQGQLHHLGAMLGRLDRGIEAGITLNRAREEGPFGDELVALLTMLTPHLKRALNMHRALSREREHHAMLRETLETLNLALIGVNGRGGVLSTTAAAKSILQVHDGLMLERGSLRAAVADEQKQLSNLLTGAVATGSGKGAEVPLRRSTAAAPEVRAGALWTPPSGGAMLISRRPPKRPLQLVVTPFYSSEILLDERPAALVFLSDPDAHPTSRAAVLRALYGLTPAECRLADLLAEGCMVAAAANVMRITVDTARTQLKAVFRKTRTARQSELVRLVLGLPGAQKVNS